MKTKLKICGIRRVEDIEMVNEIQPEFIGFIFAKSKRQIDLETALLLRQKLNPEIKSVGVFVNESIEKIVSIVNSNVIDLIQLHGVESNDFIKELKSKVSVPIIKAIIINDDFKSYTDFSAADYYLLDSGAGSGATFDWNIPLNLNKPIFIAGGISLENIELAYKVFKPYAFDLSSSVEIDGYKDLNKIGEVSLKLAELNGEINE